MKLPIPNFLVLSALLGAVAAIAQNPEGRWFFESAETPKENPGHVDLTLGIRTASSGNPFRPGNFNVRGFCSDALYGLASEQPPRLVKVWPDSFRAAMSLPPSGAGWQINAAYGGASGAGSSIMDNGTSIVTIRFFIRDTAGSSQFRFTPLDQTFSDDNITPVIVHYDTAGGDVALWYKTIPDTTTTDTTSTDTTSTDTTSSAPSSRLPEKFALFPNFPNPFNLETKIRYDLPQDCDVHIRILNLAGQTVRNLDFGKQFAGEYTTIWDGTDGSGQTVTSGVYLVQLRAGRFQKIMKILLVK